MAAAGGARRRQELAWEGQRHLEEAIAAAFQILASIDHELGDPARWSSSHPQQQQQDPPAAGGNKGAGPGGSLDDARHRYRTAVAALRASIAAVSSATQEIGSTDDKADKVEVRRLEEHASVLRKEIESKNKNIKCLLDQLRDLILDVSMWQSPFSV